VGRHWTRKVGTAATDTYTYAGSSEAVVRIEQSPTVYTDSALDANADRLATKTNSGAFGWLLPDLHGDIAAGLDSTGATVSDAFRYDPYGKLIGTPVTSAVPSPWRYQGRLLETTPGGSEPELYDFGFRAYAPTLGAFTSLDDVAGSAQNPLSLNRFLYAAADPETLVDPDGHCIRWEDDFCADKLSGSGPSKLQTASRKAHATATSRNNASDRRHQVAYKKVAGGSTAGPRRSGPAADAVLHPGGDLTDIYTDLANDDQYARGGAERLGPGECGSGWTCAAFLFGGIGLGPALLGEAGLAAGGAAFDAAGTVAGGIGTLLETGSFTEACAATNCGVVGTTALGGLLEISGGAPAGGGGGMLGSVGVESLVVAGERAEGSLAERVGGVNGNSLGSTNPQHMYEITRTDATGVSDTFKFGVSGGPVSAAGNSYRATSQVNALNAAALVAGTGERFTSTIVTWAASRRAILEDEIGAVYGYALNFGSKPIGNLRP
jgi:RHS repeat-associated protein